MPKIAAAMTMKKVRSAESGPETWEKASPPPLYFTAADRPSESKNGLNSGSAFNDNDEVGGRY